MSGRHGAGLPRRAAAVSAGEQLDLQLAAAKVCASVNPRTRRGLATRPRTARVLVEPRALAELVDALEAIRPGMLARIDAATSGGGS